MAVIGAGYAGLSAALVLARAGRNVLVLDAEEPGQGASTRNGGQVSGDVKSDFVELIDNFGLEFAKDLFAEGRRASQHLSKLIEDEGIECDFGWCGRFNAACSAKVYDPLGREADALMRRGRTNIRGWKPRWYPGMNSTGKSAATIIAEDR